MKDETRVTVMSLIKAAMSIRSRCTSRQEYVLLEKLK